MCSRTPSGWDVSCAGRSPTPRGQFAAERPFVILGAADRDGRLWATMMHGKPGLLSVPSEDRLVIGARAGPDDPLARALEGELDVGLLLIDPATRRRMRVNGARAHRTGCRSRGNDSRGLRELPEVHPAAGRDAMPLGGGTAARRARSGPYRRAGGHDRDDRHAVSREQASGRGSRRLASRRAAWIREGDCSRSSSCMPGLSAGNMMFNTLGNLAVNPRAGMLVVDFANGRTLSSAGARPSCGTPRSRPRCRRAPSRRVHDRKGRRDARFVVENRRISLAVAAK